MKTILTMIALSSVLTASAFAQSTVTPVNSVRNNPTVQADRAKLNADKDIVRADKATTKVAHEKLIADKANGAAPEVIAQDKAAIKTDRANTKAAKAVIKQDHMQLKADKKAAHDMK